MTHLFIQNVNEYRINILIINNKYTLRLHETSNFKLVSIFEFVYGCKYHLNINNKTFPSN